MCYPHVSISMFVVSEFVQAVCVRATVPVLPMMDQHQGGHSEPSQPFCPQTLIQICTPWSTKKDHRCLFTIDFSKTIEELLEEPWLHQLAELQRPRAASLSMGFTVKCTAAASLLFYLQRSCKHFWRVSAPSVLLFDGPDCFVARRGRGGSSSSSCSIAHEMRLRNGRCRGDG
ncbi:uncharacterized protein LOC133904864 isoform X1 [Phragmites australis]|uniref:uncharacterized protein LOC133904864 isoform X1 n=1 Tax=Phragmites australis TaxID=29695 RepID=UPI002D7810A6|nr:uncharacterized protein LOC133904864 isoform X1 [Phragmites australis]